MARRSRWLAVGAFCLFAWGCALARPATPPESPWEDFYLHLPNPTCLDKTGTPVEPFQSGWRPYCISAA